jgi:hypothetical protein
MMLKKIFPNNRLISAEDLMKTWRIIVMVVIGQILGLCAGFFFSIHPDKFLSAWTGAAFGTLPSFLVGTLWYFKTDDRKKGIPYFTLGFFAIASVSLSAVAFGLLNEGMESTKIIEASKRINPSVIKKLVVYKGFSKNSILEITDRIALKEFAYACQDIEGEYIQNAKPCKTIDRYYIKLNGILPKDIILDHCETEFVTGSFATRVGNVTNYYGTFHSRSLKPWLHTYVLEKVHK